MRSSVFYIVPTLKIGGAERQLVALTRRLVQKGWNVSVYSLYGEGPLLQELEAGKVKVFLPPLKSADDSPSALTGVFRLTVATFHLLFVLLKEKPRIVHFFLPAAYLVGAPLAIIAGVPIRVVTRHSMNIYQRGRPLSRIAEKILHRRMQAIIAVSFSILRELHDEERVPRDRLAVIHNGLDLAEFEDLPVQRTRAELPVDGTFVMVVVANLIPYKGHSDLLKAIAIAKPDLPVDWRLLVVGRDDGTGEELRSLADRLGIEDKVHFLGQRNDVLPILCCSHVGLVPSHQEGLSIAILEGMAAGLPMIVTDVGGSSEMVIDGESGLIVPPKNPQRLAEAIIKLAKEPDLRRRLGQSGRRLAQQKFSLELCVERHERLYSGLCDALPRSVNEILLDSRAARD